MRAFTCANCGVTFTTTWSEADRDAEAEALWTPEQRQDTVRVCTSCFHLLLRSTGNETKLRHAREFAREQERDQG